MTVFLFFFLFLFLYECIKIAIAREFFIACNFLRSGRALCNETGDLWRCKRKTRNIARCLFWKKCSFARTIIYNTRFIRRKEKKNHAIYLSIVLVSTSTIYSDNRGSLMERSRLRIHLDLSKCRWPTFGKSIRSNAVRTGSDGVDYCLFTFSILVSHTRPRSVFFLSF